MKYTYLETLDLNTNARMTGIAPHEPDEGLDALVEKNKKVLFAHQFSPAAQEMLMEECEFECTDTRIIQAIRSIAAISHTEGRLIMEERTNNDLVMHSLFGTNLRVPRPFILDACEGEDDLSEISCCKNNILEIIVYKLREGMADTVEEMHVVAARN